MKRFQKIISILTAVMLLVVGMTIGVAAEEETTGVAATTGTITLKNNKSETNVSIAGKTYTAYKVFDLIQDSTYTTYAYTLNEGFTGLFESTEFTTAFPAATVDESRTSTMYSFVSGLTTAADIEKFANVVYDFIQANKITAAKVTTKTATAAAVTGSAINEQAVFEELPLGYYIIYGTGVAVDNSSNVVTACSLDTTTRNAANTAYAVEIDVKVGVPTADKNIVKNKGQATESQVKADSQNIGSTIDFRITSEVPDLTGYTAYTFIMTDTLSKGLTFNNDIVVKIGTDTIAKGTAPDENYTVTSSTNATTGVTTVTVTFTDFYNLIKDNNYAQGTAITFDYSADINADAVIGAAGNPNTAKITYSNDPHGTTTNDTSDTIVKEYVFEFDIYKFTNDPTTNKPLAGAEFELVKGNAATPLQFVEVSANNYRVATPAEIADATVTKTTTLVSAADGNIVIKGLGADDYTLTETKAPAGYNLLESSLAVKIAPEYKTDDQKELDKLTTPATGAVYTNLADKSGIRSEIENTSGRELPSTGGMGTTILYIIGGLLIAVALIGFTVRKVARKAE